MTTDYTQCCAPQKKKAPDTPAGEPKKKKRKIPTDPDYDPFKDREETDSPQPSTSGVNLVPTTMTPNSPSITSKASDSNKTEVDQENTSANSASFKIGTSSYKPRTPTINQSRPRLQVITPVAANAGKFSSVIIITL